MRHEMLWVAAVAAALAGCGSSRPSDRDDDDDGREERVALADVPEPAMRAARDAVPGFHASGCTREMEHGTMVYEIEGTAAGKPYEVECTADGRVLEVEDADDDEDDDDDDHDD